MTLTRRQVLLSAVGLTAARPVVAAAQVEHGGHGTPPPARPATPPSPAPDPPRQSAGLAYTPVVFPNSTTLPWTLEDGVKVFRLVAEPVRRRFAPGLEVNCWGYNGESPGPAIETVEGDRVRIYVTNNLPTSTTVHWHGLFLPNGMDGIGGLTQPKIKPSQTFRYEFTLRNHGTFMYHPHFDEMFQMGLGAMGFFVVHPRTPPSPRVDRDFAIFLHEWLLVPGSYTPDPTEMTNFNLFTFNGAVFPATAPLVARLGQRVRIRIANLSTTSSHPIHLHGFSFSVTGTDGGPIPQTAQWPEVTISVPTGSVRDIEFVADAEGDWGLHCHKVHHLMNGMGHNLPVMLGVKAEDLDTRIRKYFPDYMPMGVGMAEMMEMGRPPNTIGSSFEGPFGELDAGGMFTVVKVRAGITSYDDPGWYRHPPGTVAEAVPS
jgi:FtsP/CotA-like multicopper oxidase with cupredoxin domain